MGYVILGGFMLLSLAFAVATVLVAIRTPDYDETWADDRELD